MSRFTLTPEQLDTKARAALADLERTRPRARTDHNRRSFVALHFGNACAARLFPDLGPDPDAIAAIGAPHA